MAIVGRCWPDSAASEEQENFKSLLGLANRKLPGILEEMQPARAAERRAIRELNLPPDIGIMRLSGPIVSSHMEAFAVRLALALHYHHTGEIIGPNGGVAVRLYSNVDAVAGDLPEFDFLDSPKTLSQGRMSAADEFLYEVKAVPDKSKSFAYATFRQSFAAAMISAQARNFLEDRAHGPTRVFKPGMLSGDIPILFRMRAEFSV